MQHVHWAELQACLKLVSSMVLGTALLSEALALACNHVQQSRASAVVLTKTACLTCYKLLPHSPRVST